MVLVQKNESNFIALYQINIKQRLVPQRAKRFIEIYIRWANRRNHGCL